MVTVPTSFCGDEFSANRTDTLLHSPLMTQAGTVFQVSEDAVVLPLLKIHLPGWVVGGCYVLHFNMTSDWDRDRSEEPDNNLFSILIDHMDVEDVSLLPFSSKYFLRIQLADF